MSRTKKIGSPDANPGSYPRDFAAKIKGKYLGGGKLFWKPVYLVYKTGLSGRRQAAPPLQPLILNFNWHFDNKTPAQDRWGAGRKPARLDPAGENYLFESRAYYQDRTGLTPVSYRDRLLERIILKAMGERSRQYFEFLHRLSERPVNAYRSADRDIVILARQVNREIGPGTPAAAQNGYGPGPAPQSMPAGRRELDFLSPRLSLPGEHMKGRRPSALEVRTAGPGAELVSAGRRRAGTGLAPDRGPAIISPERLGYQPENRVPVEAWLKIIHRPGQVTNRERAPKIPASIIKLLRFLPAASGPRQEDRPNRSRWPEISYRVDGRRPAGPVYTYSNLPLIYINKNKKDINEQSYHPGADPYYQFIEVPANLNYGAASSGSPKDRGSVKQWLPIGEREQRRMHYESKHLLARPAVMLHRLIDRIKTVMERKPEIRWGTEPFPVYPAAEYYFELAGAGSKEAGLVNPGKLWELRRFITSGWLQRVMQSGLRPEFETGPGEISLPDRPGPETKNNRDTLSFIPEGREYRQQARTPGRAGGDLWPWRWSPGRYFSRPYIEGGRVYVNLLENIIRSQNHRHFKLSFLLGRHETAPRYLIDKNRPPASNWAEKALRLRITRLNEIERHIISGGTSRAGINLNIWPSPAGEGQGGLRLEYGRKRAGENYRMPARVPGRRADNRLELLRSPQQQGESSLKQGIYYDLQREAVREPGLRFEQRQPFIAAQTGRGRRDETGWQGGRPGSLLPSSPYYRQRLTEPIELNPLRMLRGYTEDNRSLAKPAGASGQLWQQYIGNWLVFNKNIAHPGRRVFKGGSGSPQAFSPYYRQGPAEPIELNPLRMLRGYTEDNRPLVKPAGTSGQLWQQYIGNGLIFKNISDTGLRILEKIQGRAGNNNLPAGRQWDGGEGRWAFEDRHWTGYPGPVILHRENMRPGLTRDTVIRPPGLITARDNKRDYYGFHTLLKELGIIPSAARVPRPTASATVPGKVSDSAALAYMPPAAYDYPGYRAATGADQPERVLLWTGPGNQGWKKLWTGIDDRRLDGTKKPWPGMEQQVEVTPKLRPQPEGRAGNTPPPWLEPESRRESSLRLWQVLNNRAEYSRYLKLWLEYAPIPAPLQIDRGIKAGRIPAAANQATAPAVAGYPPAAPKEGYSFYINAPVARPMINGDRPDTVEKTKSLLWNNIVFRQWSGYIEPGVSPGRSLMSPTMSINNLILLKYRGTGRAIMDMDVRPGLEFFQSSRPAPVASAGGFDRGQLPETIINKYSRERWEFNYLFRLPGAAPQRDILPGPGERLDMMPGLASSRGLAPGTLALVKQLSGQGMMRTLPRPAGGYIQADGGRPLNSAGTSSIIKRRQFGPAVQQEQRKPAGREERASAGAVTAIKEGGRVETGSYRELILIQPERQPHSHQSAQEAARPRRAGDRTARERKEQQSRFIERTVLIQGSPAEGNNGNEYIGSRFRQLPPQRHVYALPRRTGEGRRPETRELPKRLVLKYLHSHNTQINAHGQALRQHWPRFEHPLKEGPAERLPLLRSLNKTIKIETKPASIQPARRPGLLRPGPAASPVIIYKNNYEIRSGPGAGRFSGQRTGYLNFASGLNLNHRQAAHMKAGDSPGGQPQSQEVLRAVNAEMAREKSENTLVQISKQEIKRISEQVFRQVEERMKNERQRRGLSI